MGLLSFLKSDKPVYRDKVWKTRSVAIKGMITEALMSIKQNQVPVVFYYFDDTRSNVISFLTTSGVPYFHLDNDSLDEASSQNNVVFVCDASLITSSSRLMALLGTTMKNNKIQFLFAGHYPLPSKENKIIEKLSSLYPQSNITFCSSIDDPSFEPFGADRIMSVLNQMGLKDEECIEHAMVTKAMTNARLKIESNVVHEIITTSESDWFLKNVKK